MTISIQTEFFLFTDWDFIFTFIYSEAYAHLIDANVQFMHLKNDLNQSIHINFKNCLEKITEMKEKHYYLVNKNSHNLAVLKFIKLLSKYECSEHSHLVTNSREDVSISFNIKIHQNIKSDQLKEIVNKYSNVWSDTEQMMNIFEEFWMQIRFKNNWKFIEVKFKHKFYVLLVNEQTIIDETLDKMHMQSRLEWN